MEGENNKLSEKEGRRVQSLYLFQSTHRKSEEGLGWFNLAVYCLPKSMLGHLSAKLKLIQACKILYAKLTSSVIEY